MRDAKLNNCCREFYDNNPLAYLHNSLSDQQQDELLYETYKFKKAYKKAEARVKKKKREEASIRVAMKKAAEEKYK